MRGMVVASKHDGRMVTSSPPAPWHYAYQPRNNRWIWGRVSDRPLISCPKSLPCVILTPELGSNISVTAHMALMTSSPKLRRSWSHQSPCCSLVVKGASTTRLATRRYAALDFQLGFLKSMEVAYVRCSQSGQIAASAMPIQQARPPVPSVHAPKW